jgi:protein SCO1/2
MKRLPFAAALLLAGLAVAPAFAGEPGRPSLASRIGATLDLSLLFRDSAGAEAPLAAFTAGKPALLLLGYHRCPNLCGVAQFELFEALAATGLNAENYRVLFVSIDAGETSVEAAAARQRLSEAAGARLANWRFLTGSTESVARLEKSVGMTVQPAPDRALYVHPVAVIALAPRGRIAEVLPGLDYAPRALRLAIVAASQNRLGNFSDRVLLVCSGFGTGHLTGAILSGVRVASAAGVALLAGAIFLMMRRRPT